MTLFRQTITIVVMALVPALLTGAFHPRKPSWTETRPDEVTLSSVRHWGNSVLWVDARPPADFEAQHLPGAVSLSLENWEEDLPKFLDQWTSNRNVVVYCSSTSCELSHEVAKRLRENGVSNVFVLQGGWETIRAAGLEK